LLKSWWKDAKEIINPLTVYRKVLNE